MMILETRDRCFLLLPAYQFQLVDRLFLCRCSLGYPFAYFGLGFAPLIAKANIVKPVE